MFIEERQHVKTKENQKNKRSNPAPYRNSNEDRRSEEKHTHRENERRSTCIYV